MNSPHGSSPESSPHQEGEQPSIRKRKRKTFSCDACRKRKLRCDREYPVCGRCQKSGNAANCVFETIPEPPSVPKTSTPKYQSLVADVDFRGPLYLADRLPPSYASPPPGPRYLGPTDSQAERIAQLEARVAQISNIDPAVASQDRVSKRPRLESTSVIEPSLDKSSRDTSAIGFYGQGFKTAFYGPSSARNSAAFVPAIMELFPQFKVYLIKGNLQSPAFGRLRKDALHLRKNMRVTKRVNAFTPPATLFEVIPDKDTCTLAVSLYWDTLADLYHVVHGPTFWQSFWTYWAEPMKRTEAFACTIILMMACVACVDSTKPRRYKGLSSVAREQAMYWIQTCEAWMNRQSRKHLTIESYQHKILIHLAKETNRMKAKEAWERSQALLSFGISTGLHLDTAALDNSMMHLQDHNYPPKSQSTPYEKEMRRRLWAAMVEIEIQASIDKGVPASRLVLLSNCGRPTLLLDDHFNPSSTALPAPEARDRYTGISYLSISHETLHLRAQLAEIVNAGGDHLSYDEVLRYEEKIKAALNDLPNWVKAQNKGNDRSAPWSMRACAALLELQLQQFLLLIHLPFAKRVENDSRYNLSRMTSIDAAATMLRIHNQLATETTENGRTPGSFGLHLLREDVFRATMTLCYTLIIWRGINNDLSTQWMKDVYSPRAEQGLTLTKTKALAVGEYYAQLWYSVAGIGMLKSAFEPADIDRHITFVAEDLTVLFGSIINGQEEQSNEQTAAGALTALATPNSSNGVGGGGAEVMGMPDLGVPGATGDPFMDGMGNLGNWGFDSMWPFSSTGLDW